MFQSEIEPARCPECQRVKISATLCKDCEMKAELIELAERLERRAKQDRSYSREAGSVYRQSPSRTPSTTHERGEVMASVHERDNASLVCADGVVGYRAGLDRNEDRALSHTYAMMENGELWPMCGYGWNRSDGTRFSIFRQSPGSEGDCLLCRKNVANGKPPITDGFPHKTKWL